MKIAVTHLTRMQRGYFCVAGVNVDTGEHVRPVIPNSRLHDQWCARRGGPFDMATVVDLGHVRPVPTPPEVEDHEFTPWHARAVQHIEPKLFGDMLGFLAKPTLRELFGPALRQAGWNHMIVNVAEGTSSLGVLVPRSRPRILIEERSGGGSSLRLRFSDGEVSLNLSITDLRLWEQDHVTPKWDVVGDFERRIDHGVPCLLGVGLTRPFSGRDGDEPVHWLQINNIHLEDNPCWRLSDERSSAPSKTTIRPGFSVRPYPAPLRQADDDGGDLDDLPF